MLRYTFVETLPKSWNYLKKKIASKTLISFREQGVPQKTNERNLAFTGSYNINGILEFKNLQKSLVENRVISIGQNENWKKTPQYEDLKNRERSSVTQKISKHFL